MWIVHWLPSWVFYSTLAISLGIFTLTYFLRFFPVPALYLYKIPIQIVAVVLAIISIYFLGARANEEHWQAKVRELETKVAQAEAKSNQENVRIVEKVVVQNKIIRERGQEVIKYVDKEVVKYNNVCEIPQVFIDAHNQSAEGIK